MAGRGRGRGYSFPPPPLGAVGGVDEACAVLVGPEPSPRAALDPRERDKKDVDMRKEREYIERELGEDLAIVENLESISMEDDIVLKELLYIDKQYQPLLFLLEQFSPTEDKINFNKKVRNFETTIINMCTDELKYVAAFSTLRAAALQHPVLTRKLAAVSATFIRHQQQRHLMLRTTLLNVVLQGTHSKLDVLQRANPLILINAANLIGDYFARARLANGNKVHILAPPFLDYVKALLASDDIRAHKALAAQLLQNGKELVEVMPHDLEQLFVTIRLRILSPPPCGTVWLLFTSDICLNQFEPLDPPLRQFYTYRLNLNPGPSPSAVSYGAKKKIPEKEPDSKFMDRLSQNMANASLGHDEEPKPKLRPILRAGAGAAMAARRAEPTPLVPPGVYEAWNAQQARSSLSMRYDLNSWRQELQNTQEPIYDPTVMPPNFTDYPPPRLENLQRLPPARRGDRRGNGRT